MQCHRETCAQRDVGAGRVACGDPAWPAAPEPRPKSARGAGAACPRRALQLCGRERGRQGGAVVFTLSAW